MILKGQVLEKFFSISGRIFLFLVKPFLSLAKCFLFLGKYLLFLGKCFYFSVNIFISREIFVIFWGMFLFVAKYLSFSREIVFISRGARGFGRPFRKYVD